MVSELSNFSPCEWVVEYAHSFPASRMGRLKGCPDGTATILKPLVSNPHSTPFTHCATCCWLGSTISPYSAFRSSSPQIPLYSPFLCTLLSLICRRVRNRLLFRFGKFARVRFFNKLTNKIDSGEAYIWTSSSSHNAYCRLSFQPSYSLLLISFILFTFPNASCCIFLQ